MYVCCSGKIVMSLKIPGSRFICAPMHVFKDMSKHWNKSRSMKSQTFYFGLCNWLQIVFTSMTCLLCLIMQDRKCLSVISKDEENESVIGINIECAQPVDKTADTTSPVTEKRQIPTCTEISSKKVKT